MAHQLLRNPVIAKELDKRTVEIVQKIDVTIANVIRELRKIVFAPLVTVYDEFIEVEGTEIVG